MLFFPYLLFPPTQSTCLSLWNEESVSERGVRIRTGSPNPNPNGESGSIRGVRVLNEKRSRSFQRIRSFWSDSSPIVPYQDPDCRIRSGVNDPSLIPVSLSLLIPVDCFRFAAVVGVLIF
ncbi:hypothetical protein AVEN_139032-1 [Araneus ventricosus]|uniref:Uncharacterized protein n=1 Tax=Araneus ventricosus TaxID=182803 RepID=A0A4Y2NFK2_ARAVE|nr:hypothetical protein AVEN_223999-1 [Araneus ventricosus]GBN37810.1 hypothetical protein AVEN_139032-1 [Araneus ventricosus]